MIEEVEKLPAVAELLAGVQERVLPGALLTLGLAWLLFPFYAARLAAPWNGLSVWDVPEQTFTSLLGSASTALLVLALLFFVSLGVGSMMQTFNLSLMRLLAGYAWEGGIVQKLMSGFEQRRLRALVLAANAAKKKHDSYRWVVTWRRRLAEFAPGRTARVLPTRFGNLLSAVEHYPWDVYRIDGTVLLSHLRAIMPEPAVKQVRMARRRLDTLVHTYFTSLGLALAALALLPVAELTFVAPVRFYVAAIVGATVLAVAIYPVLLTATRAWGNSVKVAIDIYRGDLLCKLGVSIPVAISAEEERAIWQELTYWLKWRRVPEGLCFRFKPTDDEE